MNELAKVRKQIDTLTYFNLKLGDAMQDVSDAQDISADGLTIKEAFALGHTVQLAMNQLNRRQNEIYSQIQALRTVEEQIR